VPQTLRVETLLAALTLEEKAALMAGADLWHSVAVPRLGIGTLRVTDGPNGARGTAFRGGPTSACFPCGSALGATWNATHADRRSRLRVLRRGSGALGAARRRIRAWAPGARRRRLRQALRRQ
jgi:beta-glucosidase-like glycosyl hydrolase